MSFFKTRFFFFLYKIGKKSLSGYIDAFKQNIEAVTQSRGSVNKSEKVREVWMINDWEK